MDFTDTWSLDILNQEQIKAVEKQIRDAAKALNEAKISQEDYNRVAAEAAAKMEALTAASRQAQAARQEAARQAQAAAEAERAAARQAAEAARQEAARQAREAAERRAAARRDAEEARERAARAAREQAAREREAAEAAAREARERAAREREDRRRRQEAEREEAGAARGRSASLIELGRAASDAQYGVAGVMNNLEQIAVTLGLGGPIVLGITAITIGVQQLITHWDKVKNLITDTSKNIEKGRFQEVGEKLAKGLEVARAVVEELAAKESFTADEAVRYLDAKGKAFAFEKQISEEQEKQTTMQALREGLTPEQKRRQAVAKSELEEAGGAEIKALEADLQDRFRRASILPDKQAEFTKRKENIDKLEQQAIGAGHRPGSSLLATIGEWRKKNDDEMALVTAQVEIQAKKQTEEIIVGLSKGSSEAFKKAREMGVGGNPLIGRVESAIAAGKTTEERRKEAEEKAEKEKEKAEKEKEKADADALKASEKSDRSAMDRVKSLMSGRIKSLELAILNGGDQAALEKDTAWAARQEGIGGKLAEKVAREMLDAANDALEKRVNTFAAATGDRDIADELARADIEEEIRKAAEAAESPEEKAKKKVSKDWKAMAEKAAQEKQGDIAKSIQQSFGDQLGLAALDFEQKNQELARRRRQVSGGKDGGGAEERAAKFAAMQHRQIEFAAQKMGARPDEAKAVADQVMEEQTKQLRAQLTNYMASTGSGQAATIALMADLIERINQSQQKALEQFQQINQLRQNARTFRPSRLPTYP